MHPGVRIFCIDDKGILQTHLLAVKLFRPDPTLGGKVTGEIVVKWTRQMLADHGIDEKDIAGAVTDNGSDVASGIGLAFPREWCFPHMINRALIDVTGMNPSGVGSKMNPDCKSLLEQAKSERH